jgi:hypothetical protein
MQVRQKYILGSLLIVISLVSVHAEIVTNLIQDAGFEGLSAGEPATGGTPWSDNVSVAPAHIEVRNGVSHSGANSVAFNHYTRTGYLSQILGVQVLADTSYELSVWMMIDEQSANSSHTEAATLNVTLASSATESGTYDWIGGDAAHKDTTPTVVGEWQQFVFEIDSSVLTNEVGNWLEVRFVKEYQPSEYRIFLDDASFGVVVPEPATMGMFGSAFALLLMYRRFFSA